MKNIPIFLASDNNYAPFVATTIFSILDNSSSLFDFYILDSGISQENKKRIEELKENFNNFSIEYIEIDIEKEFGNFPLYHEKHTLNVFSRYLIPQLKPELDKILYLDVDIIVNCDLSELFNQDLEGFQVGAIPEYTDILDVHKKELNLTKEHEYFNAGVLLIDCDAFRKNNVTKKLIEETLEIRPKFQDQDIFNIHFQNNYKILDYKYNVSWYMYDYNSRCYNKNVQKAIEKPSIIHYTTFKPWLDITVIFSEYFWQYASKTKFHKIILLEYLGKEFNQKNNQIKQKDLQIQRSSVLIQEKDTQIQEKDTQIQEKDTQIQEKDTQIQEKDTQIQEKDTQIQEKDTQIQEKDRNLDSLVRSKSYRIGNLFFRSIKKPYKLITFVPNLIKLLAK